MNPGTSTMSSAPMRVLVASVGERPEDIAFKHAQGFLLDARDLRESLGITSSWHQIATLGPEGVDRVIQQQRPDVAIIMPTWRNSAADVGAMFQRLSAIPGRPRLVFLDWYAPTSSPHFGVLPHVDRYLKRTLLVDFEEFRRPYVGGYAVADFVSRMQGLDLGDWNFGSVIPPGQEHKLWLGWNFGVARTYRRLLSLARLIRRPWALRDIDINRRLGAPAKNTTPNEWYQAYRDASLRALEPLVAKGTYRSSEFSRISRKAYIVELLRSKIVFSPFGWGEVCFRDYEAVACGALLVKPSMRHLVTSPDIYVEHETYVPVRWDLSDLVPTIEHYLAHPHEAARIAGNAQRVLRDYYHARGFAADVARSLRGLLPINTRHQGA